MFEATLIKERKEQEFTIKVDDHCFNVIIFSGKKDDYKILTNQGGDAFHLGGKKTKGILKALLKVTEWIDNYN